MRIRELLRESVSRETTLREIISVVRSVTIDQIYPTLEELATKYAANNGHLKGFRLIAGGTASRFFQTFFANRRTGLRALLETDFMQYLPQPARELLHPEFHYTKRLNSLGDIEHTFPVILARIGKIIKSEELTNAANDWAKARDHYYDHLRELNAQLEDEEDVAPTPKISKPKDKSLGQQRGQVEQLINDVLKDLPERVRGEIRQAIARDDNKLMALQRELTKRNIQLEE